jgi:hypothetical protein
VFFRQKAWSTLSVLFVPLQREDDAAVAAAAALSPETAVPTRRLSASQVSRDSGFLPSLQSASARKS